MNGYCSCILQHLFCRSAAALGLMRAEQPHNQVTCVQGNKDGTELHSFLLWSCLLAPLILYLRHPSNIIVVITNAMHVAYNKIIHV